MAFEVTSKSVQQIHPKWAEAAVLVGLYIKSNFENSSFFLFWQSTIDYDVIDSSIGFVCIHQQMTFTEWLRRDFELTGSKSSQER